MLTWFELCCRTTAFRNTSNCVVAQGDSVMPWYGWAFVALMLGVLVVGLWLGPYWSSLWKLLRHNTFQCDCLPTLFIHSRSRIPLQHKHIQLCCGTRLFTRGIWEKQWIVLRHKAFHSLENRCGTRLFNFRVSKKGVVGQGDLGTPPLFTSNFFFQTLKML